MVEQEKSQRRLEAALDYLKSEQGVSGVEQGQVPVEAVAADHSYQVPNAMPHAQAEMPHAQAEMAQAQAAMPQAAMQQPAGQSYNDSYATSFDEDDEIPAFLNEQKFQPELASRRSMTGVLVAISGLAAFTVFGAIVLYKSQLLDLNFLNANIVEGPVSEANASPTSNSKFYNSANLLPKDIDSANREGLAPSKAGSSIGNARVDGVSGSQKAWQDKLVPQQDENGSPVIVSAIESANSKLGNADKYSAGVSTFGSVASASSVEAISTKVEDLPIDEVPIEGADVTINQLESSIVSTNGASDNSVNQSTDAKILAQASKKKENVDPVLKALTDQVVDALSDLGGENGKAAVPLTDSVNRLRSSLANLVLEAESRGQSQENVELLIKEAIGGSSKNLPAALKNKDGSLDITSLLTSVVNRAKKVNSGSSADNAYLSAIEQEGQGTAVTTDKVAARYVIVKSGDSLSSISFAAYGDALEYPKIYQANRSVINNPNVLLIGTELLIP